MYAAGLGTFAPLYWTSNSSVSQYGRIQSHCWPCEPTLCSTVTTSQALQAPLLWVHPHSTGITHQRLFILLHSKAHLHFHFMSIRVSHCVTNTVVEGPVSRWPTHTMMQLYFCLLHGYCTMSTLACALEHEFPGETKMMKRTSKPWPERPQAPSVALLLHPHFLSRCHCY